MNTIALIVLIALIADIILHTWADVLNFKMLKSKELQVGLAQHNPTSFIISLS